MLVLKFHGNKYEAEKMEGKYWCLTWNNFPDGYMSVFENSNCNYFVLGTEVGESGTKHIQGYIEFATNRKLARLKKELGDSIHWEKRKGTAAQAADYCKKDGDFVEWGEISKGAANQGRRTDIENVRELALGGSGMKDIVQVATSFQALRFAETTLKYHEKKRDFKPRVIWLHGPTGSGKTRRAFEESVNPWISGKNLKWWEGYDAHKHVIIDDFRKDFCTFHELLRILDRYPYTVEVKGGSRQLLATDIWITSCFPPDEVYDTREDVGQLLRRIDEIILVSEMRSEMEVAGNTRAAPSPYDDGL